MKEEIENKFGAKLSWERLDEKRASRIKYEDPDANVFERDQWDKMIEFLIDGMIRFEAAMKEPLKKINRKHDLIWHFYLLFITSSPNDTQ